MNDQPIYSSFPQEPEPDQRVAATEIEAQQGARRVPWEFFQVMPRQPVLPEEWTEDSLKEPTEAPSYWCECGTRMYEVAFKAGRATMKCGACGLRAQVDACQGTTREAMDHEKHRVIGEAVEKAYNGMFGTRVIKLYQNGKELLP